MIVVIDALALTGLVLYIARIASPFQILRHALPFVSIVPLGIELYRVLLPNGPWIAGAIAVFATAIMVTVAALCFRTIEQLFISPLDAAREKASQDVQALTLTMEQLRVVSEAVSVFRGVDTPALTITDESAVLVPTLTKTKRVEQMADAAGVSVSTMWRRIQRGDVIVEE